MRVARIFTLNPDIMKERVEEAGGIHATACMEFRFIPDEEYYISVHESGNVVLVKIKSNILAHLESSFS
jgi:hypothetical protein